MRDFIRDRSRRSGVVSGRFRSTPSTPREERRERGPGVSCVFGPAANGKTESSYLITDCKNTSVLKSLYHERVCAHVCAPPGSTGQMLYIRCPGCLSRERSSG